MRGPRKLCLWGKAYAIITAMNSRNSAGVGSVRVAIGGYTIFEVLIVLAVSTVMLASVIAMMSGRQGKAETNQAVRDLEARLQTTASDVASGYFPNGYTCTAATSITVAATPNTGQNKGCISLGKAVVFRAGDMRTIPMVGRRVGVTSGVDVTNLTEATLTSISGRGTGPDATENYNFRYGLKVKKVVRLSDNTVNIGGIAFVPQLAGGTSNPISGSRSVLLYEMSGTSPSTDPFNSDSGNKIDTNGLTLLPGGALICLESGNGQKAEITVGGNNSQTATAVMIDTGVRNACR